MSLLLTQEQKAHTKLENYVKNYKVFMDTCSILQTDNLFWEHIYPLLNKYKKNIIIPQKCIEELNKLKLSSEAKLSENAKKKILLLEELRTKKIIEIRGEKNDNFADNVFQSVFTKFRLQHNLLLITQDKKLAKDILRLNEIESQKSQYKIVVNQINKYGYLSNTIFTGKIEQNNPQKKINKNTKLNSDSIFEICTKVTTLPDDTIPVSYVPSENMPVYTENGNIQLKNKIAQGGEGILFETNTPFVAKIYFKERNTRRRVEKIKLMLTKRINYKGICYPIAALYNRDKQFIGYLMPRAVGKELQKSIFIKPLLLKIFPTWQKRDTVELCLTILDKIKYLHDRNIILGDINPLNIMVKSPKEVYFVDTDSYQIEDFPCPVGTINYPAPEIQGKQYSEFLRTMGNENFAVATLLFMIMLPGKPPYSQQGGENPINNIKNMDFSYPFGDNSNKKTPDGPWRYIWSHLTYDLKEAFYTTFRKGEEHSTENTRLAVEQWIALFKYYQYLLDSGKFGEQDKMSEAIFPTRHKKNSNINYITCRLCQEEMPEEQCRNGICQACLNDGEEYKCKKCGEKLKFTNYHKYIKKTQKYDYCKNCFETELNRISYFTCVDCGKNFSLSQKEINFYSSKGYELPKRCKVCRDAKKNNNTVQNNNCSSQNHSLSRYSSGSSDCFITTAICEYLGKSDDCYELSLLRSYRDSWLQTQPEGMELITEYYDRAPTIVEKLKTSDKYTEYCKLLWNDYLLPCIKLIETNNYQDSLNLYRKMVTDISILLLSA